MQNWKETRGKLAGKGNTCVNHKFYVASVNGDSTSAIAPKAEQPGGSWVVPAKWGRSPASWGGIPAVPRLQLRKQTSKTLHWGKVRRWTSGTNRHRCSTRSTRSTEGVRDNWCWAASLSSPCTCGRGPRLTACTTAPPMFLWLVPVFERIQSSGRDAGETRDCCWSQSSAPTSYPVTDVQLVLVAFGSEGNLTLRQRPGNQHQILPRDWGGDVLRRRGELCGTPTDE